ncbi:MAG: hypothetical protein WDN72_03635 [Alphaproteobacteria bacterium]
MKPGASFISKVFTPNGLAHKPFEAAVDWLHAHANPKKWGRTPFFLAAEMVVMTTGGHLMVLLSKPAEDHKGKIVRAIDNVLTGGRGEENPGVKRAHEEMDAAPKQSWFLAGLGAGAGRRHRDRPAFQHGRRERALRRADHALAERHGAREILQPEARHDPPARATSCR